MSERWWICTDELKRGGRKVLGPFESRDLALEVRVYVEKDRAPETFWVDQEAKTEEEIARAAQRFEQLAEQLDTEETPAENIDDLRAVAEAADEVRVTQARLAEAVQRARGRGRSWNRISIALGVSRQAARQRFGDTPRGSARVRSEAVTFTEPPAPINAGSQP